MGSGDKGAFKRSNARFDACLTAYRVVVRLRRLPAPCFKQCSRHLKKINANSPANSITDQTRRYVLMPVFNGIETPADGQAIKVENGRLNVPDNPVIPFIEGDGTGRDIWKASVRVFDAAVEKAYGGKRRILWYEIFAGEKAFNKFNEWLPKGTLDAIQHFVVAIKGPLTTPVGGGIRSLNVTLRQVLDLYACVRPVRYFNGVPCPGKEPEKRDVVIFRENTEDVYAGIEFQEGTEKARKLIEFLSEFGYEINKDSGVGVKPISITGTKNLVRRAIRYAIERDRKVVTLVHKGNIMK